MKLKFLFIALVCCLTAGAQTPVKPEPLHEILIFKWAKDTDSIDNDVIVVIHANGKVTVTERNDEGDENIYEPKERFKMKNLENPAFEFINQQQLTKTEPGISLGEATEPGPGMQALHIHFTTVKDYNEVADKGEDYNAAEYSTVIEVDYNDHAPAVLFSHFSQKDAALLQKLLYPEK